MESLPQEIIETEFLLRLDPTSFTNYCSASKLYAKLCNRDAFWLAKVLDTSRRELQDNWFLFLAKEGKIGLVTKLLAAADQQNVIIDNRAICYATLYLLEKENEFVGNRKRLLDNLVSRAQSDKFLMKELRSIGPHHDLKIFVAYLYNNVVIFRLDLHIELSTLFGPWCTALYLREYIFDYWYRHTVDVLPSLEEYADEMVELVKIDKINSGDVGRVDWTKYDYASRIFEFTGTLVSQIVIHDSLGNNIDNFLKYVKENEELKDVGAYLQKGISYYDFIFLSVLKNGTYEQAISLTTNNKSWKDCLGYPVYPVDPKIYYRIVEISDYDIDSLSHSIRCLEPEEYIRYLKDLVEKELLDFEDMTGLLYYQAGYIRLGYTYFSLVCKEELEALGEEVPKVYAMDNTR